MPFADDKLWPEFVPIWKKLADLGAGEMLQIAGGYGLFLKQQWLLQNPDVATVIALERWVDPAPRATSDMDLLLGFEFISHDETNPEVLRLLKERGFEETRNPIGKRWQFVKAISEGKDILVELHAPTPGPEYDDLKASDIRVSRKQSLGEDGFNARHNQEAVGSELFPFRFNLEAVPLAVPNAVTWAVMKLTAMADFWLRANASASSPERRGRARDQAEKHAQDVCRVVAMMTIEERDRATVIVGGINGTEAFRKASEIFENAFLSEEWARDLLYDRWEPEAIETILSVLKEWFVPGRE